ncbi:hypothetical protein BOTBODRAFT_26790 [Botryobasidium botryosum FD-172 SS1]|uniref:CTLH domain-containing protein n=1 Tax=Botryobasidium botryosum (strain FD-172 SS1) TaxID=930990 RepID=A0A067N9I9_BOTB1|nr:hypothetical protein BOTBODRAFT_26790 [Botryobasidium botryosum FD-172 SS1]
MSATRIDHAGTLLLEQPFARIPYEQFRKTFRTSQKHIERELGAVQAATVDLVKRAREGTCDAAETARAIDGMIARAEGLKRKLSELHTNTTVPVQATIRRRLEDLAMVESLSSTDDPRFESWAETRLDRWLVDWALRNGREETARKLAQEKGIEKLVDIELFAEVRSVEEALNRRSCAEALAWCSDNKMGLRKMKSTLEFELRLQEYIELNRAGRTVEAMAYANKHFASWLETHNHEIMQSMGLLACKPTTSIASYKRLYDSQRWTTLTTNFRLAAYMLHALPTVPLLSLALYAGLASLKLPTCYERDAKAKNVDCPVCDERGLGELAREVPWSHHVNSVIVCRITGKIMDDENYPMCFPVQGYVYSREAMEAMAAENNGRVTCRETKETCLFSELRKVFIS